MKPEEDPEEIRREIRELEVRSMALRREKEDLTALAQRMPLSFHVLRGAGVVLNVLLWIVGIVGVLLLLWFAFLLLMSGLSVQ